MAVFCVMAAWGTTTFMTPSSGVSHGLEDESMQQTLATRGEDALALWARMPVTSGDLYAPAWAREFFIGTSHLEMLVADAEQDGTLLRERLDQAYGSAAAGLNVNVRICRLTARWPEACTPVITEQEDRERSGTTVAFEQVIRGRVRYTFATTSLDHVGNGAEVPIQAVLIAKERRAPAEITSTILASFGDGVRRETVALAGRSTPIVTFDSLDGNVHLQHILDPVDLLGEVTIDFTMETPPPQGALAFTIPSGWSMGRAPDEVPGWTWAEVPDLQTPAPFILRVSRDDSVPAASSMLSISLVPPEVPARAVDVLNVFFDGTSDHTSQSLALTFPSIPTNVVDQRRLLVNAHLRDDGRMFYGVVVVNGAEARTLEGLEIELPAGFVDGSPAWGLADEDSGSIVVDADASGFTWTPDTAPTMAAHDTLELGWTFDVDTSAIPALPGAVYEDLQYVQGTPAGTGRGEVAFSNGHSETVFRQMRSRGVYLVEVPPELTAEDPPGLLDDVYYSGHPVPLLPGDTETATVTFDAGGTPLTDEVEYGIALLDPDVTLRMRDALEASRVTASPEVFEMTPNAGAVKITADWSSLLSTLSEQGLASLTDTLRIYAPTSLGIAPTSEYSAIGASGLRHGIVASAWGDATGDAVDELVVVGEDGNVFGLLPVDGTEVFRWRCPAGSVVGLGVGAGKAYVAFANGSVVRRDSALTETWLHTGITATSAAFDGLPTHFVVGGASAAPATTGSVKLVNAATMTVASTQTPGSHVQAVGMATSSHLTQAWFTAVMTNGDVQSWNGLGLSVHTFSGLVDGEEQIQSDYGLDPETVADVAVLDQAGGRSVRIATTWGRSFRIDALANVAQTDGHPEEGMQVGSVTGDLTGDGIQDHAFASPEAVTLVDGASLADVWSTPWPDSIGVPAPDCLNADPDHLYLGPCLELVLGDRVPVAIASDASRVFAVTTSSSGLETVALSSAGAHLWQTAQDPSDAAVLATGSFLTVPYVATADAQGHVDLVRASDGAGGWSMSVTDLTGLFTYRFDVGPGFYLGTYVLESELTWTQTDALGDDFTERARLLSVLDLVDPADPTPAYAVTVQAWLRDWKERS